MMTTPMALRPPTLSTYDLSHPGSNLGADLHLRNPVPIRESHARRSLLSYSSDPHRSTHFPDRTPTPMHATHPPQSAAASPAEDKSASTHSHTSPAISKTANRLSAGVRSPDKLRASCGKPLPSKSARSLPWSQTGSHDGSVPSSRAAPPRLAVSV